MQVSWSSVLARYEYVLVHLLSKGALSIGGKAVQSYARSRLLVVSIPTAFALSGT